MKIYRHTRITAEHDYEIRLPDGKIAHLTPGTTISNITPFAGAGLKKQIRDIKRIVSTYGGSPNDWKKIAGIGYVDIDGESTKSEIHWYQRNKYRYEMKVKRFL